MMEVLWPSAGRALELLRGSKVNLEESELVALSSHPDRRQHKRTAEHSLDDSSDRNALVAAQSYMQFSPTGHYSTQQQQHPALEATTSTSGAPVYFSYAPDDALSSGHPHQHHQHPANNGMLYVPGTLSTSVLPQLYSTGLVDERGRASAMHHHNGVHHGHQQHQQEQQHRYPQYWNDYSSFPQLGSAYVLNDQPQPHSPTSPTSAHPASQVFLAEPYNLYSNHQPPSSLR